MQDLTVLIQLQCFINSSVNGGSRPSLYSTMEIGGMCSRKDSVYGLNSKFLTAGIFVHLMLLMQGNTIKSQGADLHLSVPEKQTRNANTACSLKLLLIIS